MKKTILLFILSFFVLSQALAQDNWWDQDPTGYLPLVREGVKWVNEKIIINHGDTTSYYYTYEIKGDDPNSHLYSQGHAKLCHYYTGDNIDCSNDSIISSIEEEIAPETYINCFNNWALDKVVQEGRNIRRHIFWVGNDDGELLYRFFPTYPEGLILVHFYTEFQEEPAVLTDENFRMIEPIEIDGYSCNRYAYIKENGDTMCYVVEGIGFDSRNMGDLLTPFTREPDPDADYQEYCGLCHVIKDGKIIYKGMRYTPDNMTGLDEVVTDRPREGAAALDPNYYNLMGQPVGTMLPSVPGIYIHHGNKILVR